MDGILGRIDAVINGPTPNLSSHLINYDGRSIARSHRLSALPYSDSKGDGRRLVVRLSRICASLSLGRIEEGPITVMGNVMSLNTFTCDSICNHGEKADFTRNFAERSDDN